MRDRWPPGHQLLSDQAPQPRTQMRLAARSKTRESSDQQPHIRVDAGFWAHLAVAGAGGVIVAARGAHQAPGGSLVRRKAGRADLRVRRVAWFEEAGRRESGAA